ncbi:MAG: nuclear transport factor 2 family protein [Rhodoferax sp.]|nr:nuclear transport factor 2 family protein [Rhodoferax sp.]
MPTPTVRDRPPPRTPDTEVELHHPGVRSSRERPEQLLHPEFDEVGRSGRSYSRETVINFLSTQESRPAVVSQGFAVTALGPGVALLTYRSAQVGPDKSLETHTLRSSIWLQTGA